MARNITITVGDTSFAAELNDSPTASAIHAALPIEGRANLWGQEIYFQTAIEAPPAADARREFGVGELGYWPPGRAFCIFFGPTPASTDATPVMADAGNPIGAILGDCSALTDAAQGASVVVTQEND